ncbi:hypothetical protein DL96DRAFT_1603441 [Flagelloscypha sp. PMI_526]|nr:hypothetical protein DL96DRAFT_1603441 [Flagelloscypha sp. PMI_526]
MALAVIILSRVQLFGLHYVFCEPGCRKSSGMSPVIVLTFSKSSILQSSKPMPSPSSFTSSYPPWGSFSQSTPQPSLVP